MLVSQQEIAAEALTILDHVRKNRRNRNDDYCIHGKYVGGCGIDWMCQWCEDGTSDRDYAWHIATERAKKRQQQYVGETLVPLLSRLSTSAVYAALSETEQAAFWNGFMVLID